jgi:hypothetical protein
MGGTRDIGHGTWDMGTSSQNEELQVRPSTPNHHILISNLGPLLLLPRPPLSIPTVRVLTLRHIPLEILLSIRPGLPSSLFKRYVSLLFPLPWQAPLQRPIPPIAFCLDGGIHKENSTLGLLYLQEIPPRYVIYYYPCLGSMGSQPAY